MRKWYLLWGLALVMALVMTACNGDKDKKDGEETPPDATEAAQVEPDVESTEEASGAYELVPLEPGLHVQNGLTLVAQAQGQQGGTAYFFGEVRNDTEQTLSWLDTVIYQLDADGFELGIVNGNSLLTAIPPGKTVYVGTSYDAPEGYADAQIWVRYEADPTTLAAFYDLPVTVDYSGPGDNLPYTVRGTAQNTTGRDLSVSVIDVVLIGPDDNLVGFTRGVLSTSGPGQVWPAGETASFEALFGFVAVDATQVKEARVAAAGYASAE
jgi:hypothetical protein